MFQADDVIFARTPRGSYLRVSPAPDAPADWGLSAARAAEQHTEARRREHIPARTGPVILRDCTDISHASSPATHLEEILSCRGYTVQRQETSGSQVAPVIEGHAEVRPLLVTIGATPPIPGARGSSGTATESEGARRSSTLQHLDLLDIHPEGAQWFLHPLRLTPYDPSAEQVLRRRLAATPAHQALATWWRLASDPEQNLSNTRLFHIARHRLSPSGAAIVAWHAAQIIGTWAQGRASPKTSQLRRRLTIVDTHTMEITRHPVLPYPIPHGNTPEDFGE